MSVRAPSNLPGTHSSEILITDSNKGWDYQRGNFTDLFPYPVMDAESIKSATIHGDRVSAYPYRRTITSLDTDSPAIVQYRNQNSTNGFVQTEYTETTHISVVMPIRGISLPFQHLDMSENAEARSTVEALNKLQANKMQLGVDAFEAKKTLGQLADIYQTSMRLIHAIKHGHTAVIKKILNEGSISGKFLGYQFGVAPLAGSLTDAYHQARASLEKGTSLASQSTRKWSDTWTTKHRGLISTYRSSGGSKTKVTARVDNTFLARANALGLGNPLSVGWELVPWSFVVDWFMPVGAYLEAWTSSFGLEYTGGFVTTWRDMTVSTTVDSARNDYNGPGGYRKTLNSGSHVASFKQTIRKISSGFPDVRIYAKDNPFTTPHILDAIAIVDQLYRRPVG